MTTADQRPMATLSDWGHDIYPKLSWFRQDLVDQAQVMVVGCGALGNEVLKNLVLFGVRHLVIVDFDEVEKSNLTRSILYTAADARQHRRKVEAAAERLRAINPAVEVTTIDGDICYDVGLEVVRRTQVVIGYVDNRWARYCINRLCLRAGIPWVDGGIEGLEGTVRVFVPGKNCYACNLGTEGLKELARRQPCSGIIRRNEEAGRIPTTPIIASVIGAVEVQEAMKLLHPEQLEKGELTSLCGQVFYYEGQHLTTRDYTATVTRHFLWSRGILAVSAQGGFREGSGEPCTDGTFTTGGSAPATMEAFLYQDWHLLTAPQYHIGLQVKYAFRCPGTRLKTYVAAAIRHHKANGQRNGYCGRDYTTASLTLGCSF